MKKAYIALIVLAVFLVGGLAGYFGASDIASELTVSEGTVVFSRNGEAILLGLDGPVVLTDKSKKGELFADIEEGSLIKVIRGLEETTYPGRTDAYFIFGVKKGYFGETENKQMNLLKEYGWLEGEKAFPNITAEDIKAVEINYYKKDVATGQALLAEDSFKEAASQLGKLEGAHTGWSKSHGERVEITVKTEKGEKTTAVLYLDTNTVKFGNVYYVATPTMGEVWDWAWSYAAEDTAVSDEAVSEIQNYAEDFPEISRAVLYNKGIAEELEVTDGRLIDTVNYIMYSVAEGSDGYITGVLTASEIEEYYKSEEIMYIALELVEGTSQDYSRYDRAIISRNMVIMTDSDSVSYHGEGNPYNECIIPYFGDYGGEDIPNILEQYF